MHGLRFRRAGLGLAACATAILLGGCHGAASPQGLPSTGSGAKVDVDAACSALADLQHSGNALDGVDVADPDASLAALDRAVSAYSSALLTFERVGPAALRAPAAAVRRAVVAHHFAQAVTERAAIDAWATKNCGS